ncbi:MAG: phosphatase [Opitutus sp.]
MVQARSVAVIDIGSNSIKVLVAARAADGETVSLHERSIEARISAGIGGVDPLLAEDGMARGLEAIRSLLGDVARFSPARTLLVATSAVRDAHNGNEFCGRVRKATGHEIRILGGNEEAGFIGRGLACDPALRRLQDFHIYDLGGGSLECLSFRRRRLEQAISLQLGCVRLMERFVRDPIAPFPAMAAGLIAEHVRTTFESSGFSLSLPSGAIAIGSGGTVITARAVLGAREGKTFEQTTPAIPVAQLRELLVWLGTMPLADRKAVRGLPAARADVFPTALAILIALAETGGFTAYHNSVFNLRFGLADEALPPGPVSHQFPLPAG